ENKQLISANYSDSRGGTQKDISDCVTMLTLRPGEISIYTVPPPVERGMELFPPRPRWTIKAAMARGPTTGGPSDFIPESLTVYDFALDLMKTDEGWVVEAADWTPALAK